MQRSHIDFLNIWSLWVSCCQAWGIEGSIFSNWSCWYCPSCSQRDSLH
jgi:hypothetical protein